MLTHVSCVEYSCDRPLSSFRRGAHWYVRLERASTKSFNWCDGVVELDADRFYLATRNLCAVELCEGEVTRHGFLLPAIAF